MDFVNIFQKIESILTLDKVKNDFINYTKISKKKSVIISYDTNDFEKQEFDITVQDSLAIFTILLKKKYYNSIYIPIQVHLAIGKIQKTETNVVYIEKCIAEMLYMEDFVLVDIDFNHCKTGYS